MAKWIIIILIALCSNYVTMAQDFSNNYFISDNNVLNYNLTNEHAITPFANPAIFNSYKYIWEFYFAWENLYQIDKMNMFTLAFEKEFYVPIKITSKISALDSIYQNFEIELACKKVFTNKLSIGSSYRWQQQRFTSSNFIHHSYFNLGFIWDKILKTSYSNFSAALHSSIFHKQHSSSKNYLGYGEIAILWKYHKIYQIAFVIQANKIVADKYKLQKIIQQSYQTFKHFQINLAIALKPVQWSISILFNFANKQSALHLAKHPFLGYSKKISYIQSQKKGVAKTTP